MRILVSYRGIPQSPGWSTGDMVVRAFRALGHHAEPYARYYETNEWVKSKPYDGDWDLLLFMECNDGEPQYHELAQTRARKTACWLFDTSYYPDHLTRLVHSFGFEYQFIANPLDVDLYPNGHYMPYACDSRLHRRYDHEKQYDVSLIGSVRSDRENLKYKLAEQGVDLELIGGVFREEYIDALAASRITVNQNPDQGAGLLNMRFWEAQAAGSLVFTENRDFKANVEAGLKNVTAIAYEDSEDLAHSCSTLLKCEYLQETMVSAGQERIFGYHTYESRCKSILETVFQ